MRFLRLNISTIYFSNRTYATEALLNSSHNKHKNKIKAWAYLLVRIVIKKGILPIITPSFTNQKTTSSYNNVYMDNWY